MTPLTRAMVKIEKALVGLEPSALAVVANWFHSLYCPTTAPATKPPRPQGNTDFLNRALLKNPHLCRAIQVRDQDRCRYCLVAVSWRDRRSPTGATYDHVDPFGDNTLENVVVACHRCNVTKKDRTPELAGMTLHPPPGLDAGSNLDLNGSEPVANQGGDPTPSSFLIPESLSPKQFPEELQEIPVYLRKISAPSAFEDVEFWVRIHAWLESSDVGYLDELPAYLAWNAVQNGARKHRDLRAGFRNWLAKSAYWSEQRAQRQAVRRGR